MSRMKFALGAIIAIAAVLIVPNAPMHIAKASSCSSSSSESKIPVQGSQSFSGSGSCSTSSAGYSSQTIGRNPSGGISVVGPDVDNSANGGKGGSCSAISGPSIIGGEQHTASGSVSCSSHAP
jgi:hypothetical protein